MSSNVAVRCRCGEVEGLVRNVSPATVTRVVCYCDDCQAFAHRLGRADLLDASGGSDIVQVAPSTVTFSRGAEHIAGLRLSPKGLYRWYTDCCKTPVGNTLKPAIPFVGIVAQAFDVGAGGRALDDVAGAPRGRILGKFAIGEPPAGSTKLDLRLLGRAVRAILGWRLTGKAWPNPFFDRAAATTRYPVVVVPAAEREALRSLCGPRPAAAASPGS